MTKIIEKYAEARQHLHIVERDRHVKVLFACESGSRAWGFASPDSDYDVRFIYTRPISSYLSLASRRDVLDQQDIPLSGDIDLAGWDVIKALSLAATSNPQIVEWLHGPIRYHEYAPFVEELTDIMREYNPRAIVHHYASMAHNQYKNYVAKTGEKVRFKKYLYALRPLFSVSWIECYGYDGHPPIDFAELYDSVRHRVPGLNEVGITTEIATLLHKKARSNEAEMQERLPNVEAYIVANVARARQVALTTFDERYPDMMRLEDLCRRTIKQFG